MKAFVTATGILAYAFAGFMTGTVIYDNNAPSGERPTLVRTTVDKLESSKAAIVAYDAEDSGAAIMGGLGAPIWPIYWAVQEAAAATRYIRNADKACKLVEPFNDR